MSGPDGWRNEKQLYELERPLAVEHLVYEVRAEAYETWKAADYEFWTRGEADQFPSFRGKDIWLQKGEWYKITILIYWDSFEDWFAIDHGWIDRQEQRFAEVVGADNYRLVYAGHETPDRFYKISEYR